VSNDWHNEADGDVEEAIPEESHASNGKELEDTDEFAHVEVERVWRNSRIESSEVGHRPLQVSAIFNTTCLCYSSDSESLLALSEE
jgi:hypothetical protein